MLGSSPGKHATVLHCCVCVPSGGALLRRRCCRAGLFAFKGALLSLRKAQYAE